MFFWNSLSPMHPNVHSSTIDNSQETEQPKRPLTDLYLGEQQSEQKDLCRCSSKPSHYTAKLQPRVRNLSKVSGTGGGWGGSGV